MVDSCCTRNWNFKMVNIFPTFNAADNTFVEKTSEKTPQNDRLCIHKSWFKSSPLLTFVVLHNWYILYIKLYHLMPFRKFTHVAAAYIWKHSLPRTVNQIFWIDAIKKYNLFSEILETYSDKHFCLKDLYLFHHSWYLSANI